MLKNMLILGIESTCDETAASIVEDGSKILSNIIFSQTEYHKKYGGVFPELASRCHIDKILPTIEKSLNAANVKIEDIDAIAVAQGPGLIGSLLIGLNTAKTLSLFLNKPLIGINHVEAHLYAAMMDKMEFLTLPALGVVISGGHTMLLKISKIGTYEIISTTIDDAIGECFDKAASILDLPYPGGPEVEKLAKLGDSSKYNFKSGQVKEKPYHFSFSGLKTKILYTVKGQSGKKENLDVIDEIEKKHIAASFQKAAFTDLIEKSLKAARQYNLKAIYFGGGVSNNNKLKEMIEEKNDLNIPIFWPSFGLSLDNAAMIAGLAYHKYTNSFDSRIDIEAKTSFCSF